MYKRKIILFLSCFFSIFIYAQKTDARLMKQLQPILKEFHGEVGVYVKNLNNGKVVAINADTIFPTASMIKIPILIGLMDKIESGELDYHQEIVYRDSLLYAGVDILGSFKDSEKIEVNKVMLLMLTMSDNTASLWLQSLAGTGTRINQILDSLGFENTRVNSRTPGREKDRSMYGWGQTTPREMATLVERIYNNQIVSPAACMRMQRSLSRNYWDAYAISSIPPNVQVLSKGGAVDESRNEVLLVNGPNRYVFCICTKSNADTSWNLKNEAWQMTRKISALLWNYFEPKNKWMPPVNADEFN